MSRINAFHRILYTLTQNICDYIIPVVRTSRARDVIVTRWMDGRFPLLKLTKSLRRHSKICV